MMQLIYTTQKPIENGKYGNGFKKMKKWQHFYILASKNADPKKLENANTISKNKYKWP